jgi:hypothetical protein
MITQHLITALAVSYGESAKLDVVDASITLDNTWSPYVQASLTVAPNEALSATSILNRTDPYLNTRVQIYVQESFGSSETLAHLSNIYNSQTLADISAYWSGLTLENLTGEWYKPWNGAVIDGVRRFFNLKVRTASIDVETQLIRLTLASDESLLGDYAELDTEPYAPNILTASTAASYVLSKIGAYLQAGYSDANIDVEGSVWEPGDNAWSYIQSLLDSVQLRLYCDEQRRWYLTNTSTTGTDHTLAYGTDYISLTQDTGLDSDFYSAAVVKYSWTDNAGVQQVRYDSYRNPRYNYVKVLKVELNRRYPGPGAAQAIVNRKDQKTITRRSTIVNDYTYSPGDGLTYDGGDWYPPIVNNSPLFGTTNKGYVSSVTWSLPSDRMTIQSKHPHTSGGGLGPNSGYGVGDSNENMGA